MLVVHTARYIILSIFTPYATSLLHVFMLLFHCSFIYYAYVIRIFVGHPFAIKDPMILQPTKYLQMKYQALQIL
jgi:hypothetical protein